MVLTMFYSPNSIFLRHFQVSGAYYDLFCLQRWTDEYLVWDPDEYDGITSVRLSSEKIWIPDIMLYNT